MLTITETEIIKLRDKLPLSLLKKINDECIKRFGYVSYRKIFETMGYRHAFNNEWEII